MDNNENVKNKKKNLFLILVVIVIVLLIGIGLIYFINNKENIKSPEINVKEPEVELNEEEAGNMINDLYLIGLDLYNSGEYVNLPQMGSVYYATKGKLKELGYTNIDKLVLDNCSDEHSVLFFDVENANNDLIGDPISAVHDCSTFIVE